MFGWMNEELFYVGKIYRMNEFVDKESRDDKIDKNDEGRPLVTVSAKHMW